MQRKSGIFHWSVFVGQIIYQDCVNHFDVLSQIISNGSFKVLWKDSRNKEAYSFLSQGYSMHRVIPVRQYTAKPGDQIQRQKSPKRGCRLGLMDFIATLFSSSYGWATPPGTRRPGHAEHVDVASQYAECFASDLAGFSLQQRLVE